MNEITLNAYAKLNLSLDVCGKRANGYHDVDMIMTSCSLCDEIALKKSDKIILTSSSQGLSCGEDNLMIKAARAFFEYTKVSGGTEMYLEKNIPIAAGMAGGSTDAAAVLKGLNELYQTGLDENELCKIGLGLGADVPYCIKGKTMRAQGIGEQLTYIGDIKDVYVAIVKIKEGLSTGDIYSKIDRETTLDHPDNELLCKFIKDGNIKALAENMKNVMEQVSIKKIPEIEEIKKVLMNSGALGAMMSGSGPSVFGLFESEREAQEALENINPDYFTFCGKIL